MTEMRNWMLQHKYNLHDVKKYLLDLQFQLCHVKSLQILTPVLTNKKKWTD